MKRISSLALILLVAILTYAAPNCNSVVNIVCYNADGTLLRSGYGFFISADGKVCTPYKLLVGATRADIIDWRGRKFSAERIAGASSANDIALLTSSARKVDYLNIIGSEAKEGEVANLLYYTTNKKDKPALATITKTEAYGEFSYYTTDVTNNSKYYGCPLTNSNGEAIGIIQQNVTDSTAFSYAIDARFCTKLNIDPTSVLNSDFSNIGLPRLLPTDEVSAYSLVYMLAQAPQSTPLIITTAINDYVSAYPDSIKGYIERATYHSNTKAYAEADKDIAAALGLGRQTDEVHYHYGRLIFTAASNDADDAAKHDWVLSKARDEAEKAYSIKPQPLYQILLADIAFADGRYDDAQALYTQVATSDFGAPEHYYHAARACRFKGGEKIDEICLREVGDLLDKALAGYRSPYPNEATIFLLERAQNSIALGEYRRAVTDLNEYEKTVTPNNLNAEFYLWRMQAERSAKMYKQALDDGQTALSRSNQEQATATMLEIALTYLQAGSYAEAAEVSSNLVKAFPDNADAQKIFGIALGYLGRKAEAVTHLERARELGDDSVETFIQKFGNGKK